MLSLFRLHTDFLEAVLDDEWEIVEEDEDEARDHQLFTKDTIHAALQSVISHRNQSSSGWPFSTIPQPDIRSVLSLTGTKMYIMW